MAPHSYRVRVREEEGHGRRKDEGGKSGG